jgi:hypothetical protein
MPGLLYGLGVRVTAYRPNGRSFFETPGPNAVVFEELRIQFQCEKHLGSDPDTASLIISNMSGEEQAAFQHRPVSVVVSAGFDGERKFLFSGDVRNAPTYHRAPEVETEIMLGDGDRAYRHAKVSRSFKKGAKVIDAVRDAARAMGLEVPSSVNTSDELAQAFSGGHTIEGNARDELTNLLAPYGMRWQIQGGALQILRSGDTRSSEALPITEENGFLSAQWNNPKKPGKPATLTITSLLYPEVLPGSRLSVRTPDASGIFRAERVGHSGENFGAATTTIEAKPL